MNYNISDANYNPQPTSPPKSTNEPFYWPTRFDSHRGHGGVLDARKFLHTRPTTTCPPAEPKTGAWRAIKCSASNLRAPTRVAEERRPLTILVPDHPYCFPDCVWVCVRVCLCEAFGPFFSFFLYVVID